MIAYSQGAARGTRGSPRRLATVVALASCLFFGVAASAQTVAEVEGEKIDAGDLKQAAGQALAALEEQAYRLKQQNLQQLIGDRLIAHEAERRKMSVDALVEAEIASKVAPVSAEDIHALYDANKNQLPRPESELKDQLDAYLRAQRMAVRRQEFVLSLQAAADVKVYLTAPAPFRAELHGDGPVQGDASAPVTIVVFEDFQCPFCKQVHETLERVVARYKDKVRLVHRDFPLDALHPAAWRAHEAARCAEQQGKFWEYRNLLYANAPAASPEQLGRYASDAGVDPAAFGRCVEGDRFKAEIEADVKEGERLGINGTPAFFINGRLLSGSQPESEFSRIIDEELAAQR